MTTIADGLSGLKDLADWKRMFAAGTTGDLWGVLNAHQDMCERHQLQQLAATSQASLAVQQEALRYAERTEASLLGRVHEAEKRLQDLTDSLNQQRHRQTAEQEQLLADQRRRALLPKCPDCHTSLEATQPRRCASCRTELFWLGNDPFTRVTVLPAAQSGWGVACVQDCVRSLATAASQLAAALCSVSPWGYGTVDACEAELKRRQALTSALDSAKSVEAKKNKHTRQLLQQRYDAVRKLLADNDSSLKLAQLDFGPTGPSKRKELAESHSRLIKELATHNAALASHDSGESSEARKLASQRQSIADGPPSVNQLNLACLRAIEAREVLATCSNVLERVRETRALLGGDENTMPSVLESQAKSPPPPPIGEFLAVRLPGERAYQQIKTSELASWIEQHSLGIEMVKSSRGEGVRMIRDVLPAYFTGAGDLRLVNHLLTTGVPRIETPSDEDRQAHILELLLPGLCVVASADGVLKAAEVTQMASLLQQSGCHLSSDMLHRQIVEVSRRIHKSGVSVAIHEITQQLTPYIGHAVCAMFLDLATKVAAADGRIGTRESKCLRLLRNALVPPAK